MTFNLCLNSNDYMNLQKQIQRRQIFEKLHLKEILHSSVGVMLPSPDTWFKNEVDQIEIKRPTKILRFFAGWAKRYLMTSPLHPSQTLVQTKIILPSQLSQDLQSFYQYKTQQNGVEVGVEVGDGARSTTSISVLSSEAGTLAIVDGTRDVERARAMVARWIGV